MAPILAKQDCSKLAMSCFPGFSDKDNSYVFNIEPRLYQYKQAAIYREEEVSAKGSFLNCVFEQNKQPALNQIDNMRINHFIRWMGLTFPAFTTEIWANNVHRNEIFHKQLGVLLKEMSAAKPGPDRLVIKEKIEQLKADKLKGNNGSQTKIGPQFYESFRFQIRQDGSCKVQQHIYSHIEGNLIGGFKNPSKYFRITEFPKRVKPYHNYEIYFRTDSTDLNNDIDEMNRKSCIYYKKNKLGEGLPEPIDYSNLIKLAKQEKVKQIAMINEAKRLKKKTPVKEWGPLNEMMSSGNKQNSLLNRKVLEYLKLQSEQRVSRKTKNMFKGYC